MRHGDKVNNLGRSKSHRVALLKNLGCSLIEHKRIVTTVAKAKTMLGKGKPICILMKTIMGKGVDFMEGTHEWHGIAPNDLQLEKALAQLPETLGDY